MNTQHPEAAKIKCPTCEGNTSITCYTCFGEGYVLPSMYIGNPPSAPHEREAQGEEDLEARRAPYNRGMESMKQTMEIELDFRNTIIDDLKQQLSGAQKRIEELEKRAKEGWDARHKWFEFAGNRQRQIWDLEVKVSELSKQIVSDQEWAKYKITEQQTRIEELEDALKDRIEGHEKESKMLTAMGNRSLDRISELEKEVTQWKQKFTDTSKMTELIGYKLSDAQSTLTRIQSADLEKLWEENRNNTFDSRDDIMTKDQFLTALHQLIHPKQ